MKISVLEAVKAEKLKKGETLSAEDEKFLGELDAALTKELVSYLGEVNKGVLQKGVFKEFLTEKRDDVLAALDLKEAKIENKTIGDWLRTLDAAVTKASKSAAKAGRDGTGALKGLKRLYMDNIEVIEKAFEAGKNVTLGMKAATIMGTDNTMDTTAIEEAGDITESFSLLGLVNQRRDKQYIFDLVNRQIVSEVPEHYVWYEEGDTQGAMAIVQQGGLKPLIQLTVVKQVSEAKKVAGKIVVNEEFPKFRPRIWAMIQQLFSQKIVRDYADMLTTDIIASAAGYVGTTLDGTIAVPTPFHCIGAGAAQLEVLNYDPDLLILNPQDKWAMALSQDTMGRFYTNLVVSGANGQVQVMGFRVITTNKCGVGEFVLGESGLYRVIEEGVQMRMGYGISLGAGDAVESDFDHNRFRIIAEFFYHSFIPAVFEGSFMKGSFAVIKEALQAPGEGMA